MHITRSFEGRAEELSRESEEVTRRVSLLSKLSGFALQLYSWYIQNGHARDEKDEKALKALIRAAVTLNQSKLKKSRRSN